MMLVWRQDKVSSINAGYLNKIIFSLIRLHHKPLQLKNKSTAGCFQLAVDFYVFIYLALSALLLFFLLDALATRTTYAINNTTIIPTIIKNRGEATILPTTVIMYFN